MSSETPAEFRNLLLRAREKRGLTRDQLARLVGLDPSHLFRIETGDRKPSRDSALALAVALELDDDAINQWLVAAGYAPVAAVGALRDSVRARGTVRTRGSAGNKGLAAAAGQLWDASARARRLESLGLTEAGIARLLESMAASGLADQEKAAAAISGALERVTEVLDSPVRAAVIPAAGKFHRALATAFMQTLLPRVIREAAESGISRIVLVLAPGSSEILFEPLQLALEMALVPMVSLTYVEQPAPEGLGAAVLLAEQKIGQEPFAVLLPDDGLREAKVPWSSRDLRHMVRAFRDLEGASLVAVRPEPRARLARGGAARLGRAGKGGILPVLEMVEKPSAGTAIANARSVQGIVGRYILQPEIFSALRAVTGTAPFLELTDALAWLVRRGTKVCAYQVEAQRSDIGAVLDAAQGLMSR